MGKKARKTRWRALSITGENSDSEESNTHSGSNQISKSYQQKPYYAKLTYSSQSTPIRNRFQNDTKSTRSSSTNSDNKITFNEDEYTRITTPRQDVLFKKGYLSKPKTYQTQTSTGNSTISTGNSTGNGTPDHQSADGTEGTDLEYESQFVFPNGFVDHNGIYYINSYEPYPPLVVYNAPYCYTECPSSRSKRYSTDSLTESTSPHNEETSQDMSQSGGETVNNISEFNPVFNVMYPGYYYNNGIHAPTEIENGQTTTEPRKIKKRRRRKLSKPIPDGSTTSDEYESDEAISEIENRIIQGTHRPQTTSPIEEKTPTETEEKQSPPTTTTSTTTTSNTSEEEKQLTSLKPDAKEFVPRAYRVEPLHYVPNFIPLPPPPYDGIPNFNPAFLPPGIPINFIHPDHKFVQFIPNYVPSNNNSNNNNNKTEQITEVKEEKVVEEEVVKTFPKNNIDIEKIVSKLEEAAKEQRFYDRKQKMSPKFGKQRLGLRKQPEVTTKTTKPEVVEVKEVKTVVASPQKQSYNKVIIKPNIEAKIKKPQEVVVKVQVQTPKRVVVDNCSNVKKLPQVKTPNQWIPVSRKKRKNKNVESEVDFEESNDVVEDGFESYDVNKLEDVVIVEKIEEDNKIVPEEIVFQDVRDVEEALIQEVVKEEKKNEIDDLIKSLEEIEAKNKKKRQPQKPKRVIITDVDLSGIETPKKTPVKVTKKVDNKKEVIEEDVVKDKIEVVKELDVVKEVVDVKEDVKEIVKEVTKIVAVVETPEKKKTKKNKKKITKPKTLSNSSSTATLNAADDTYDFLLNNTVLEDEKTNVEISEELDKIIQRGMYSSLQEKIKTLNIVAANDGFFKSISINNNKTEKANFLKTNDLGTVLKKTTNIFQERRPSTEEFNKISELEPTVSGSFLDVANVQKDPGINLYPITQAVKEWMTKTRETTPEVELLKSPSTILKELQPKNGFDSRATSPGVNGDDDEVTIWSLTPEDTISIEEDLLDCWDDGGLSPPTTKVDVVVVDDGVKIDAAEDVLEVYESNYGSNEDYNKLKAEIEERKRKGTFPKHANLPYRAICCSLM